jgi:hypothetical protein
VNYIYVQRWLSTMVAVANLCGTVMTRLKTGKSAGSPSFEELPRTSHLRARYESLYRSNARLCSSLSLCFKISNTSLPMYSLM